MVDCVEGEMIMDYKDYMAVEGEKPLDRMPLDGGFCGIFRSIGAIGDSLSSGEFETINPDGSKNYLDCFDYSWGQYLARIAGVKVTNFSRGGMTAKEYCTSFGDKHGYFGKDRACGGYIVALGVNDVVNQHMTVGSTADINTENYSDHPDTFCGWYGELLMRYREISPDAKFFLVTAPRCVKTGVDSDCFAAKMNSAIRELAAYFDRTYLIDLWEYAPVYDEKFSENFFLEGHLAPTGYMLTAKMFASYIDYIIRHNPDDFKKAGLIPAQYAPSFL